MRNPRIPADLKIIVSHWPTVRAAAMRFNLDFTILDGYLNRGKIMPHYEAKRVSEAYEIKMVGEAKEVEGRR